MYFALRKGGKHTSFPFYGCGGPGHVAAKHFTISNVLIEECKNVTSSPHQEDFVNLVLDKLSDELKQENISDQLEVQKICSKSEDEMIARAPTTAEEVELESSSYQSPTSGKTGTKRSIGYCQAIYVILIGTITSAFMNASSLS